MRRPTSLQWRLALWLGGLFILIILLASLAVTALMRHEMDEVFDSALQETAQRVLPLAVMELINHEGRLGEGRSIARLTPHEEYLTYVVLNRDQQVLLRSHDADAEMFPPYRYSGFVTTQTHRIYYDTAVQGSYRIAVAEPLAHRNQVTGEMFITVAVPLLVGVPLSLVLVWWVVRLSLRPVRSLQADVSQRTGTDMRPVSTADLPSEIAPLAEAINHLLVRVEQSLDAERSFSRNAAHEIRTPLAAALAQTQRLLAATGDDTTTERARTVEQSLLRLNRLSEKLLQLARAESARFDEGPPFEVGPVFDLVLSEFSHHPESTPPLEVVRPEAPIHSRMDPDAWAILLRNLVENALKHGPRDEPVAVTLGAEGALTVINGGPAVPSDQLERLTRPFERAQSRADGSGLGLAIAHTLARVGGGRLILISPATGRDHGFEARFEPGEAAV